MTKKTYFIKKPPFINRIQEKQYFLNYFNGSSTNILFVYGPKSTGKTTLIKKIITENLDKKHYDVNFLNLRSVLMTNFKDFKNLFFPENLKGKVKKSLGTIGEIGAFGFKWNPGEEHIIETNLFGLMEDKLINLNKQGIKPVIILDEFQYLKDIYLDDKKDIKLINELFKFFIAMTKQNSLAHVVCLTSDSYFLEELYNDAKLVNTSDFFMMEHLSKKDIFHWLEEKEKIDTKIVNKIWKNLGGSVWEIWQVLVHYKNTGEHKPKLDDLLQVKYSLIAEWYVLTPEKIKDNFITVITQLVKKGKYVLTLEDNFGYIIKELVDKDLWFYNAKYRTITANSKSLEKAFGRLLKELKK